MQIAIDSIHRNTCISYFICTGLYDLYRLKIIFGLVSYLIYRFFLKIFSQLGEFSTFCLQHKSHISISTTFLAS